MELLSRLLDKRLSNKETLYSLVDVFLDKNTDARGLYGSCKSWNNRLGESCPICDKRLKPAAKREFIIKTRRKETLAGTPCKTSTCNNLIHGYLSDRPRYRLFMFQSQFNMSMRKHYVDIQNDYVEEKQEEHDLFWNQRMAKYNRNRGLLGLRCR